MGDRVLLFTDDGGLPMVLRHLAVSKVAGVVAASVRPQQHAAMRGLAADAGLALLIQPKHEDRAYGPFLSAVSALRPNFILVNSYSMKLWPDLLRLVGGRGVNIHGGLLPQYRGANPIQWAIIRDEREAGVTMHLLEDEIDAGPIIAQRRVPIRFDDTWREVHQRIAAATEELLAGDLAAAVEGSARSRVQDAALAGTYRRRRPEDGRIEWKARVLDIYNLIRALVSPLPGAFYEVAGTRRVLSKRTTVQEVVALKFSDVGVGPASAAGFALEAVGGPADDSVTFRLRSSDGADLGVAAVAGIDWEARTGRCQVKVPDTGARPGDLRSFIRSFARQELGLAVPEAAAP